MAQLANTPFLLFLINYVAINGSKNELGGFNFLPSGWLKKSYKLGIMSLSDSKNQEQWAK